MLYYKHIGVWVLSGQWWWHFRIYLLLLLRYDFCNIKKTLTFWFFFIELTICTIVQTFWIYLLRLLRYDLFKILNFDFQFGQEVKVKLGSLLNQYFLTNNDLYNGAKILNLPLVVVEIWFIVIRHDDLIMTSQILFHLLVMF